MLAFTVSCLVSVSMLSGLFLCFAGQARASDAAGEDADWTAERTNMVAVLRRYGIRNERVLAAMSKVRRQRYIPAAFRDRSSAYGDYPLPIGHAQTISQPYIVAYMTEKLDLKPGEKVLEIGTGSGYQAAILAELGAEVFTIEIIPELGAHARTVLSEEGYPKVQVLTGDGYKGWPAHSPFDAIIVTCAPEEVPPTLVDQLKEGGRMIIPVGSGGQRLVILNKTRGQVEKTDDLPVRFVPMTRGKTRPDNDK